MLGAQLDRQLVALVGARSLALELRPLRRKLVAHREQTHGSHRLRRLDCCRHILHCFLAQQASADLDTGRVASTARKVQGSRID